MNFYLDRLAEQIELIVDIKVNRCFETLLQRYAQVESRINDHNQILSKILDMQRELQKAMNPHFRHKTSQSMSDTTVQCSICYKEIFEASIQGRCGHEYHESCLQRKTKQQIETGQFGICIGKRDNKICFEKINITLCNFPTPVRERLQNLQMQNQLNMLRTRLSECPQPKCDFVFKINPNLPPLNMCPMCKTLMCLKCQQLAGSNHQCQQKQFPLQINGKWCQNCGKLSKYRFGEIQCKCGI